MSSNILILGANGYVGRHIALTLKDSDYNITLGDIQKESLDGNSNYSQVDITNPDTFSGLIKNQDYIFNFAGITGTYAGFENYEKFVAVNVTGLLHLLTLVKDNNPNAKIIFPSTRLVYKGQKDTPLKEDDKKEFKTVYAMNKFDAEHYLKMFQDIYNIRYTIFRVCVSYGNLIDDKLSFGTINHFVSKAKNGENISLFGDGSQKRTFTHIEDIANIIIEAGMSDKTDNNTYNLGGPDALSIKEAATQVAAVHGVEVDSTPWPKEHQLVESGDTIFDSSKLEGTINYTYKHSFSGWVSSLKS